MLDEMDVRDEQGSIIISPGLKVRHKGSQYEYTVDNVIEDPDGEVNVILKMPETPRFEPPVDDKGVIQDHNRQTKFLYEVDPSGLYVVDTETDDSELDRHGSLEPEDLLSVTQSEFEKEYEVK